MQYQGGVFGIAFPKSQQTPSRPFSTLTDGGLRRKFLDVTRVRFIIECGLPSHFSVEDTYFSVFVRQYSLLLSFAYLLLVQERHFDIRFFVQE